ncbi:IclR family transcriptional regulator [Aquamicrobium terrae]|uniref:DNA-binding IclR family transcriptional regulator n=1 Tax=Aquamicrobium terrae TaxID=1324945 RepID=A0ABV2N7D2_9HYPH
MVKDEPDDDLESDRYIVPALKRGLDILRLFTQERTEITIADMAREIGVARSSTFRLAYTLEALGFLERKPDRTSFRLGSGILSAGFVYLSSLEITQVAFQPLERLRGLTGLSAHLAIRDGRDIVHLLRVGSLEGLTSNVKIGERRPAHATPMGRVLLCELDDAALDKLYSSAKLERTTPATPASLAELKAQLRTDRQLGYVVSHGTYSPGGCSVAAPIRDRSGKIVAAINVVGQRNSEIDKLLETTIADEVLAAAAEISLRMGFDPKD